jgi:2-keto-4-pentenoate hydratase/2-oxohepta-3-ene-1,7-dioic acid hydratase in catechol pathway
MVDREGRLRKLSQQIQDFSASALLPASLEALRVLDPTTLPLVEGTPRIGPCVGAVGKIIGVGLNYADHAAESNMAIPAEPPLFMKATSAIIGPNDDIEIPRGSDRTDWEVELGVVIGKPGNYISEKCAHIAGYCVVNERSRRRPIGSSPGIFCEDLRGGVMSRPCRVAVSADLLSRSGKSR